MVIGEHLMRNGSKWFPRCLEVEKLPKTRYHLPVPGSQQGSKQLVLEKAHAVIRRLSCR